MKQNRVSSTLGPVLWTVAGRQSQLIAANDMLIAAHALDVDAIPVTDNTAEFTRVAGLPIENRLRPAT
ncbi:MULTISPECIES: hypothetical protein [Burkholderia]|uniref:hypothetical protein n=1 Tax=Burkholderia TaxID=32008 RepID=UPI0021AB6DD7|nr:MULTISPECIES: hypothetical protein [Burkholderia]